MTSEAPNPLPDEEKQRQAVPDRAGGVETDDDRRAAATLAVWQQLYLDYIAGGHSPVQAAAAIGISRSTGWRWRQDPAFMARVIEAQKVNLQDLETEAKRRAMNGSDKLMMFLLQAENPERYTPKQRVEHSGQVDLAQALQAARARSGR